MSADTSRENCERVRRNNETHTNRLERFFEMTIQGEDGCLLWAGTKYWFGHGQFWTGRSRVYAHRFAWEYANGAEVPAGLCVLHKCDVPQCVNPDHLFVGTKRDNAIDASAKGRLPGQKKTHCPSGHEYAGDNLIFGVRGERRCAICEKRHQAASHEKQRLRRLALRASE